MQNFDEYRKRCLGMEDDQLRSAAHESSRPTEMRDIAREVLYGKLEVYKTKAGVFASTVSAQADVARLELGRYQALAQVKSMEWDGYKAKAELIHRLYQAFQ